MGKQQVGRPALRRFILGLALFWAPVLLVVGVLELAIWRSGEVMPTRQVLEVQNSATREVVWLRGYVDQDFSRYKWLGFQRKRPQVLALGSSRVMHFRSEMFGADGARFYNMGGAVRSIDDLVQWKRATPDALLPKVLILGVDEWWFNDNWQQSFTFSEDIREDHITWQSHLLAMRGLLRPSGLKLAARLVSRGRHAGRLGLRAEAYNEGFRRDGSQQNVKPPPTVEELPEFVTSKNRLMLRRIRTETERYVPAPGVSPTKLNQLKEILTELKAKNVLVLGFAGPFTEGFVDAIEAAPRRKKLWNDFHAMLPGVFAEFGYPIVVAPRPSTLGLDDRYMWDAHHAQDTLHLYVIREYLKDARVREALPTTLQAVEAAIESPKTDPYYPDLGVGKSLMEGAGGVKRTARSALR